MVLLQKIQKRDSEWKNNKVIDSRLINYEQLYFTTLKLNIIEYYMNFVTFYKFNLHIIIIHYLFLY